VPLFGDTVSRELHDEVKAQRDLLQAKVAWWEQHYADTVKDVMELKRHDLGLPAKHEKAEDPFAALGPKTWSAGRRRRSTPL
jgi:hypothetical protein